MESMQGYISKMEQDCEDLRSEAERLQQELQQSRDHTGELGALRGQLQQLQHASQSQAQDLSSRVEKLQRELEESQGQCHELREELGQSDARGQELLAEVQGLRQQLSTSQEMLKVEQHESPATSDSSQAWSEAVRRMCDEVEALTGGRGGARQSTACAVRPEDIHEVVAVLQHALASLQANHQAALDAADTKRPAAAREEPPVLAASTSGAAAVEAMHALAEEKEQLSSELSDIKKKMLALVKRTKADADKASREAEAREVRLAALAEEAAELRAQLELGKVSETGGGEGRGGR